MQKSKLDTSKKFFSRKYLHNIFRDDYWVQRLLDLKTNKKKTLILRMQFKCDVALRETFLGFYLAGKYYKSAQLEYYKFTQRLLQICSGITNLLQICAGITNMRITKVNTIVNFFFVFKYSCFQMVKNHMHFEHKYAITKGLSSVEISPTIMSKSIVF